MKLSNLIQRQENLILNGNGFKLSNYIKTKEVVTQANDIKTIFNMTNNFREHRFNYYGDGRDGNLFTTGNVSFPSILDGPTVYKYFNNMTINEDHIITTENRCKGLVIYCCGDCTINGTLSMTARGCRGVGEHFKPNKLDELNTPDGIIDMSIGAEGGAGGAGRRVRGSYANGYGGSSGINGACGGGGGGRAGSGGTGTRYATSGNGSQATTWSGGAGGGGADGNRSYTVTAGHGGINGGAGGGGHARQNGTSSQIARFAGGGAGNNGGPRSCSYSCGTATNGQSGTGGLIILVISGNLIINGIIRSNGMNGGNGRGGGGSSGGGSITVLYKENYINNGSVQVNGGASVSYGGAGGAGSIRIQKIL